MFLGKLTNFGKKWTFRKCPHFFVKNVRELNLRTRGFSHVCVICDICVIYIICNICVICVICDICVIRDIICVIVSSLTSVSSMSSLSSLLKVDILHVRRISPPSGRCLHMDSEHPSWGEDVVAPR